MLEGLGVFLLYFFGLVPMDFREYQIKAHSTAIYPRIIVIKNQKDIQTAHRLGIETADISYIYPILGLCGETGELANKIKKVIRDDGFEISEEKKKQIKKEKGDIKWYDAESDTELGISSNESATENLKELQIRQVKNLIKGSGDDRENGKP